MEKMLFSASIGGLRDLNDTFAAGDMQVCHTGENRNGSYLTRQAVLNAAESIYNCPVVCVYKSETDSIGGHDEPGQEVTRPVGIVPESAEWEFRVIEENGEEREYFCCQVLIWKREQVYEKLLRDGGAPLSMEISINSGHRENGLYYIDDFTFSAFCLLGSGEPCFSSARLELKSFSDALSEMRETARCAGFSLPAETQPCPADNGEKEPETAQERLNALEARTAALEEELKALLERVNLLSPMDRHLDSVDRMNRASRAGAGAEEFSRLPLLRESVSPEPYGGVFREYGII